jgi:hypothetical protein
MRHSPRPMRVPASETFARPDLCAATNDHAEGVCESQQRSKRPSSEPASLRPWVSSASRLDTAAEEAGFGLWWQDASSPTLNARCSLDHLI